MATTIACALLVSGCAKPYCAATDTLWLSEEAGTAEWLNANDPSLLDDIIVHNRTRKAAGC